VRQLPPPIHNHLPTGEQREARAQSQVTSHRFGRPVTGTRVRRTCGSCRPPIHNHLPTGEQRGARAQSQVTSHRSVAL